MPFVTFGLFGWCMAHGTGLSTIDQQSAAGRKVAATTTTGWAIMNGINVVMGTLSPMLVNQPDLARYCKKPRDAGWLQGASVFISKVLIFFLGLAATSSMQGEYGKAYWNMWDLNNAILDHNWTPTARFGVFLVSFSYLFSTFGTNLGANSIPFGADMTGLFPKYLTIRRGQILCAILGVTLVPWKLIATAQTFITFLGSYNIFMAPLCAVSFTPRLRAHIKLTLQKTYRSLSSIIVLAARATFIFHHYIAALRVACTGSLVASISSVFLPGVQARSWVCLASWQHTIPSSCLKLEKICIRWAGS